MASKASKWPTICVSYGHHHHEVVSYIYSFNDALWLGSSLQKLLINSLNNKYCNIIIFITHFINSYNSIQQKPNYIRYTRYLSIAFTSYCELLNNHRLFVDNRIIKKHPYKSDFNFNNFQMLFSWLVDYLDG